MSEKIKVSLKTIEYGKLLSALQRAGIDDGDMEAVVKQVDILLTVAKIEEDNRILAMISDRLSGNTEAAA